MRRQVVVWVGRPRACRPDSALGRAAVVDLGPDHYARLTAIARLIQVLAAGRPIAKAAEVKRHHVDGVKMQR